MMLHVCTLAEWYATLKYAILSRYSCDLYCTILMKFMSRSNTKQIPMLSPAVKIDESVANSTDGHSIILRWEYSKREKYSQFVQ